MDPRPPVAVPPDALVAHAGFVRGLAYAILRDDADADDATQEALVVGLASGPRDPAAARGWLAAVVRNVAYRFRRREARSETRERRASRAEAATSTVDLMTREETLRSVVDAVGALDPASREVVLLRHYEDLPPRAIAARLGLPVETVKKRLARAHATLRARLDAGEGASRRRRALAAFAGLPLGPREGTAAIAAGGGVAMASGTKAAALAAVALLVVGGSVWVVADGDGRDASTPEAPGALSERVRTDSGAVLPLAAAPRGRAAADLISTRGPEVGAPPVPAVAPPVDETIELPPATIEGVVLGVGGPISGADITLRPQMVDEVASAALLGAGRSRRTGDDGAFAWSALGGSWATFVEVRPPRGSVRRMYVRSSDRSARRPLVARVGNGSVEGTAFDRAGQPVVGRTVQLATGPWIVEAITDGSGRYRLEGVPDGTWTLSMQLEDGPPSKDADSHVASVRVVDGTEVHVDLGSARAGGLWTGAIRLGSGSPVRGPATILLAAPGVIVRVPLDTEGRVSHRVPAGSYRVQLTRLGRIVEAPIPTLEMPAEDFTGDLVVPGVRLSGTARLDLPAGTARSEHRISIIVTPDASATGPGESRTAVTDADGRFELLGMPAGRHRVDAILLMAARPIVAETTVDVGDRDISDLELVLRPK